MNNEPTVPGEFRCPECGFVVTNSILNPTTGACGRDSADRLEPCPNDGTILRPVLYADALNEARLEACRSFRLRDALKACVSALDGLLGDSDLPDDDRPGVVAMQQARELLQ